MVRLGYSMNMRWKIELPIQRAHTVGVTVHIEFVVAIQVVESAESMLPSIWRGDREFHAAQQIVQLRPVTWIWRQRCERGTVSNRHERIVAVEIPLAGNP